MLWSKSSLLTALAAILCMSSCKTLPEVPLTTPKPLEVNLNMRLDIYQYRGDEPLDKEAAKGASEATTRMRNRMVEVQTLKNNQLVGEDHRGLLQIREVPAGDWGPQMKKAVTAENEDRMLLTRLRCGQAETGEWIKIPNTKPGPFELKRVDSNTTPPASQPITTLHIPTTPKP